MRLIHTADVHLDASFKSAGAPPGFGNKRRQALREVLRDILLRAKEWPADAVLIAGDLFEHDRISRDTIAFLRDAFAAIAPIPIIIAPGNHDPYLSDSPYVTETWPENVFIFKKPAWDEFTFQDIKLSVHGFAFDGFDISANPFGRLQVPEDGNLHVAVAHGSERGHQPPGKTSYAPFDGRDAADPNLHYLALGHFHRCMRIEGDFHTRMYYAGAPEGHGFDEPGVHHHLEIEIQPGKPETRVLVKEVPICRSLYYTTTLSCESFSNSQQLIDALIAMAKNDPDHALIARVKLSGMAFRSLQAELNNVYEAVADAFEFIELIDQTHPQEDYDGLARETTSLGLFIRRMNEEIADAPSEERRDLLVRAREVALAAYRGVDLPVRGLERGRT